MTRDWKRSLLSAAGVALIITGLVVAGRLGWQLFQQWQAENGQDHAWQQFTQAARGQADVLPADAGNIYLKLTIPRLSNKSGVAVDGDWNSLTTASMVHYRASPAPGTKGNVLVAFHRETHWMDINQVKAGDQVLVQTRDLVTHTYQVDYVKTINPSDVSMLKPTDGDDLTLITCDPPWQDYNRMVFRAHLVTG